MLTLANLVELLIFILPAYFANSAPVIFKTGRTRTPIDFKMKFYDSRRIFGEGKTWAGFLVGVTVGTLIGVFTYFSGLSNLYPTFDSHLLAAFVLSFGTMTGDALGSFFKRRLRFGSGKPMYVLDQLSFFIVAIAFVYPIKPEVLGLLAFLFLAVVTLIVHTLANVLAYRMGLKKVPW